MQLLRVGRLAKLHLRLVQRLLQLGLACQSLRHLLLLLLGTKLGQLLLVELDLTVSLGQLGAQSLDLVPEVSGCWLGGKACLLGLQLLCGQLLLLLIVEDACRGLPAGGQRLLEGVQWSTFQQHR